MTGKKKVNTEDSQTSITLTKISPQTFKEQEIKLKKYKLRVHKLQNMLNSGKIIQTQNNYIQELMSSKIENIISYIKDL